MLSRPLADLAALDVKPVATHAPMVDLPSHNAACYNAVAKRAPVRQLLRTVAPSTLLRQSRPPTLRHRIGCKAFSFRMSNTPGKSCIVVADASPGSSSLHATACRRCIATASRPKFALHALRSTLDTPHPTLHTPNFRLHTLHFTLHTLHSTLPSLCTPHFALYTYTPHYTSHSHFRLHTLHFTLTLYTLHSTLLDSTLNITLHTLDSTLYALL